MASFRSLVLPTSFTKERLPEPKGSGVVAASTPLREDAPRDPQDGRRPEQANFTWEQEELISLPSDLPLLRTLQKELSQPTASEGTRMRLVIDKQPEGTRSPNLRRCSGDGLLARRALCRHGVGVNA
jgi:hypothetical protein